MAERIMGKEIVRWVVSAGTESGHIVPRLKEELHSENSMLKPHIEDGVYVDEENPCAVAWGSVSEGDIGCFNH